MNREKSSPPIGKWLGGMDNVHPADELESSDRRIPSAVRRALNVDFDARGYVQRRAGYALVASGSMHSLWAPEDWPYALYVSGDQLYRLDPDETRTALTTVLVGKHFSWAAMNGSAYGSNGVQRLRVDATGVLFPWGVADPGGQPAMAQQSTGGLTGGRYQVAVTFAMASGEESGSENPVVCVVPDNGGISLTAVPQPPAGMSVTAVRIYCSGPNGDILYFAKSLAVGTLTTTLGQFTPGRALETSLYNRVLPSTTVRAFRGRLYMAAGKTLYYTAALRPGLLKLHECSIRLPHTITGAAVTTEGIFVGTDTATYFLAGDDPKNMKLRQVDTFGILPRTELHLRGSVFEQDRTSQNMVAVWWNTNSVLVRGNPDGSITPLTAGRLALPRYTSGAVLLREAEGIRQLLSTMRGPGEDSAFAARDTATAEIVRNGVLI